ncbi:MAG: NTP transferase domain-containing protein [Desulfobacteraceae bacterium]|nr:NTP transferase domain-containing protein [Pseudomonadota bacterium]MBU4259435.1 NTP transferase domain-containing protein [Pseudomonadota bacterium]MBU4387933.1 NTP transferase domain-containing protein [Pseudomonadota bacterium]MCG2759025.1 NTP transferase domain-containing protein [Desulfobacteraceae bacterium]
MQTAIDSVAAVILAAGMGTRMKSNKAKVLHEIIGRPMVMYVVETARKVVGNNVVLVIGNQADKIKKIVSERTDVIFAIQEKQLGTGHAVLCAQLYIPEHTDQVVILCGDVPLITNYTLMRLIDDHIKAMRDISILAVEIDNPKGYGRILLDEDRNVTGIVEEADATEEQKGIKTINTGIYCVKKDYLFDSLKKIKSDNVQGELYLTDIIGIGYKEGKNIGVLVGTDIEEVIGVNNREDLKKAEIIMRKRLYKTS